MKMAYCRLTGLTGHDAGRDLLRELYLEETGAEPPEVLISQRGYPYFKDSPYWFSIAHTRKHAFCVLAKQRVGIDAEEMDRTVRLSLADRILSDHERRQYDEAEDKNRAMLTFWVLKEADAKCTGMGLQGFPNRTEFDLDDPRVTQVDGCYVAIITEGDRDNAV